MLDQTVLRYESLSRVVKLPLKKYQEQERVNRLIKLREEAGLTQLKAAEFFWLARADSIGGWVTPPQHKHRGRFIVYLVDKLELRNEPEKIIEIWNDVMVGVWKWDELNEIEIADYLKNLKVKEIAPGFNVESEKEFPYLTVVPIMINLNGGGDSAT